MKTAFWKADWFVGLCTVIVFAAAGAGSNLLAALEYKAYDLGVGLSSRAPSDRIAIIEIDQQSIDNIGRWPWPRDVHAQLLDKLVAAKPKAVVSTILFTEPQQDRGTDVLRQIRDIYRKQNAGTTVAADGTVIAGNDQFGNLLDEAVSKLDFDGQLADSIGKGGNVLIPMLLARGTPQGNPDAATPTFITRNGLQAAGEAKPLSSAAMAAPIARLGEKAAAIGFMTSLPDSDGVVREDALVMSYYDQLYPSISLMTVAKTLNIPPKQISIKPGEGIQVGGLLIPTTAHSTSYSYYYKPQNGRSAFPTDSFFDVLSGKVPAEKYRDKIVLIGSTAAGIGTSFVTPIDPATSPVVLVANNISSLLQQDSFAVPGWGDYLRLALGLVVALYLTLLLPRLKAGPAAMVTGGSFAALLLTHFVLITTQLIWLKLMSAAVLLVVGHLVLTTKRFLTTERGMERSELSAAESNRMLGLAFQGQGQLDMAFDKFRKVPMDDSMADTLYNLALDFERKRQFNKAETVYQHIAAFNPKFKDINKKLDRAHQMAETVILGGGSNRSNASTLVLEGGAVEKPMLGRYQVEKELGKGAMGVVYLGKDPKIGRVVAIKTMALSQEFEPGELEEARTRFFREAETAGRLNHPNIVTIYDAGEEHDLCYIAMEFLKGKDLAPQTKAGSLLPIPDVLNIAAQVADALDYAHKQSVVHRDIKPANVMYEMDTRIVKVTDFGIARITDASKTKTGMVLGTPSYMSPEQLSGKRVDGRSDLFSLGVMLYQMTVGTLPFQGESMA
uniref:CHASE2 domain-containing serine/threonine-protein kinase n=1 Tax=Chitinimonas sp. TaxID=1934313 RepID=UPI0035AF5898